MPSAVCLPYHVGKDGYTLVDIKPDKTDFDGKRTVFVFKNENNIMEKIKEYKEK